jgi:hypothetical protein
MEIMRHGDDESLRVCTSQTQSEQPRPLVFLRILIPSQAGRGSHRGKQAGEEDTLANSSK